MADTVKSTTQRFHKYQNTKTFLFRVDIKSQIKAQSESV